MNVSVLYLPSSDPEYHVLLQEWTARAGYALAVVRDAYELCLHVLRDAHRRAAYVFISIDSLMPDEWEVFSCVAQAWPHCCLAAIGATRDRMPDETPVQACLESPASLRAWLKTLPAHNAPANTRSLAENR